MNLLKTIRANIVIQALAIHAIANMVSEDAAVFSGNTDAAIQEQKKYDKLMQIIITLNAAEAELNQYLLENPTNG